MLHAFCPSPLSTCCSCATPVRTRTRHRLERIFGVHLIAGSRAAGKGGGHPLMTQCQASNSRLPTLLSALVAECLFSDWPRQRDTSGQDPFAAVLRCSLFELFAQPLQKRRQNELRGSQVEAQTDSTDSENRQTDGQRDRAPAPSSSGELKCSKMTKLISSPDTGLESFGLSMATDAAGTRQQQQQQPGLLSN